VAQYLIEKGCPQPTPRVQYLDLRLL